MAKVEIDFATFRRLVISAKKDPNWATERAEIINKNHAHRKEVRLAKALPTLESLEQHFPIFHLAVEPCKYTLVNNTGYKVNEDSMDSQVELFKTYNQENMAEGGMAVKQVTVVIHSNPCGSEDECFTDGWQPSQDVQNIDRNINRAYLVEFMDGTSSGWLHWASAHSVEDAVVRAANTVRLLAELPSSRMHVRTAVDLSMQKKG